MQPEAHAFHHFHRRVFEATASQAIHQGSFTECILQQQRAENGVANVYASFRQRQLQEFELGEMSIQECTVADQDKAGQMKAAIQQFEPLLKTTPPSSSEADRLNILLGMAHYGLQDHADAVPYLRAAAARDPQNLELRLALAHSCLWSKQYQCVLDTYHEMLLLNAESAEVDMLAGEAMDAMKDPVGAIQQFRAAIRANPNEPEVHFGLGYLLWTQRQYPEAASEFKAELATNPQHAPALTYLADTSIQLNQPGTAAPLLQNAIRIDPSIELAHVDLGILCADSARQNEALGQLQIAARLAPNDTNVHWRLGRLYKSMGRMQDAKLEFNKASSLHKAENDALINKMNPGSFPAGQHNSDAHTN